MVFNELAQWAVIILIAVCVFGLLRQLGQFMVPRKEQLLSLGPDIGARIPETLIDDPATRSELMRSAAEHEGIGLVAVLHDGCLGCRALVEGLREEGRPMEGPMVAFFEGTDEEIRGVLETHFDLLVDDPAGSRAKAAGIMASPFVMVFDEHLQIVHRAITPAIGDVVDHVLHGHDEAEADLSATVMAVPAVATTNGDRG